MVWRAHWRPPVHLKAGGAGWGRLAIAFAAAVRCDRTNCLRARRALRLVTATHAAQDLGALAWGAQAVQGVHAMHAAIWRRCCRQMLDTMLDRHLLWSPLYTPPAFGTLHFSKQINHTATTVHGFAPAVIKIAFYCKGIASLDFTLKCNMSGARLQIVAGSLNLTRRVISDLGRTHYTLW